MNTEGLISTASLSTRSVNMKRSEYVTKAVKKNRAAEAEQEGWEVIPSKLKASVKVRKRKKHNDAFEDRVWALFARMGFEYLNGGSKYTLEYAPRLTKQIDVFAADSEVVLLVECKSSETRRRANYQKDINELAGMTSGLRDAAKAVVGGAPKVAFIFATNNSVLGDSDRKRLAESRILHFTQDDISYFEQLADNLGAAAKYQLFGHVFAGMKIPELRSKVPAVRGKMAGKYAFYSFSIEPEYLLKVGFVLHRTETTQEAASAYQRLIKKPRLMSIASFIDKGGFFPNAIIINIHTSSDRPLKFETTDVTEYDTVYKAGILHLPQYYRSAFIIDGQHRLMGYAMTTSQTGHTIPVVAFHNLPADEQARLFVDINHEQKSVPANLLHSLMADFYWDSMDDKLAVQALKTRLLTEMNGNEQCPLYKRLVLSEERKTQTRCLTLETLKTWGLPNKTGFFGTFRNDKLVGTGYLTGTNNEETLKKALAFFNRCFLKIESGLQTQWDLGSAPGGFIAMNLGVSAIFRTLDSILEHLERKEGIKAELISGENLADRVTRYLDPVIDFVAGLDEEGTVTLRSLFGSGATEKVLREFQNAIHNRFESFNPEGLNEWVITTSGKYNSLAHSLGFEKIEPRIHKVVERELKRQYGEANWWRLGVPKEIQKSCSTRQIDEGSAEPPEHFLLTLDYLQIIQHKPNWVFLSNFFTAPNMHNASKEDRLAWIGRFNAIRKKYSHPQRENISEEEFRFLEELWEWLEKNTMNPIAN